MKHEIISNERLIELAHSKQIKIHLVLNDGTWRNGFVVEINPNFFMFKDDKNLEEPFFFLQIKNVEPFTEDKKRVENEV